MSPDNGHLLEELGRITYVAWKKQQEEERDEEDKGSTYGSPIKHDTHVIRPGWTLDINRQDSSERREWAIQRLRGRKVMWQSR